LFSVLLHMNMNTYTLHTQKHTLLHSWTLDVIHGSTTHQDVRMLPSLMHLLYCTTYSKFLIPHPPMVLQPLMVQGPLITVASRSQSDAPHSCRTTLDEWLPRHKDPYVTTHNTHRRQISTPPPRGIETHNPSKWTVADPHLTPRGHCNQPKCLNTVRIHVAQLVEALRYKPEGLGFDSRCWHCNFSLT
jgi:hypothetical protein